MHKSCSKNVDEIDARAQKKFSEFQPRDGQDVIPYVLSRENWDGLCSYFFVEKIDVVGLRKKDGQFFFARKSLKTKIVSDERV